MRQPPDGSYAKPHTGKMRGLRRLAIVASVIWFGFWWGRAFLAYLEYHQLTRDNFFNQFDAVAEAAWYRAIDSLVASGIYPLLLAIFLYVARWVWRGFRTN